MKIEKGMKLVMIGDSVTDCGRARPVGEGSNGALGNGYVQQVTALLEAVYPERHIRVVNMGISGNNVVNLKERWDTDVMELQPDWLTIMIGINDVWRQYDLPHQPERHVLPEEYRETLYMLIEKTLPSLRGGMILMTPYYIEDQTGDQMRARMDAYGRIVKEAGEKYQVPVVDTQAAFNEQLKHCHSSSMAWDRVHPNQVGHMVLTRALLKVLDFKW